MKIFMLMLVLMVDISGGSLEPGVQPEAAFMPGTVFFGDEKRAACDAMAKEVMTKMAELPPEERNFYGAPIVNVYTQCIDITDQMGSQT